MSKETKEKEKEKKEKITQARSKFIPKRDLEIKDEKEG